MDRNFNAFLISQSHAVSNAWQFAVVDWGGHVRMTLNQGCRPKTVTRGLCCRRYVDHAFKHAHFCIYDNNMLVKSVYVKVLKKEKASIGL